MIPSFALQLEIVISYGTGWQNASMDTPLYFLTITKKPLYGTFTNTPLFSYNEKKKINVLFSESTNTHHWEIYKLPLSFSGNY